ncbi:hypothetical protein AZI85_13270 [Bdellovibrio bacteriovorus]|uniref:Metallo-beta-lactamase domain-containing protein n=1 Tax=Bdellovibrio bacteriovorus TaxID=959 RepID=A0A150WC25_BDEBC|nr:MBL fold metallo-hydrolase [Bdellovibrio bacteriovorus]KYG60432.1 hypothetical protein AZI85_13270 [Bdellovibrio bacteriovorus]
MLKSFFVLLIMFGVSSAQARAFNVTLLGTGNPWPRPERMGPAVVVKVGEESFLFDVGRGAYLQLHKAGIATKSLRHIFLTHLHSDHTVGLPDLWLSSSLVSRGLEAWEISGPQGTKSFISYMQKAFSADTETRIREDKTPQVKFKINVHEITEGLVYNKNGIKITAFKVEHGPIGEAFGYRIDAEGKSVVISGDTVYSENLIKHSKGVDLLIHEVAYFTGVEVKSSPVLSHHTLPDQAGRVFSQVKPGKAVYTHIVVSKDITPEKLIELTRKTYQGPLVVGEDLMFFELNK